jgi:NDP-sugar pyrophosphorylase family protein
MLNIVIPMAGKGSRFTEAGYTTPKPFLPIQGIPMIERVIENVRPSEPHRIILIHLMEHQELLKDIPHDVAIPITQVTDGAACTVLLARELIDTTDSLLVANSDQYVDWEVNDFIEKSSWYDAAILTLPANEEKYSYAQVKGTEVIRTAEKKVISPFGTVGIYWWKNGRDFVRSATRMIAEDDRFNNEFYVCPTFNYLPRTKRIGHYLLPSSKCHFLGAPKEYEAYLSSL